MKWFLLLLGGACVACNGSASRAEKSQQSTDAASGGAGASTALAARGTTLATPSSPRLSTVSFAGLDGVDMNAPLVLAISETEDGHASQAVNYVADDGHIRLVLALDYDAAAEGARVALGGDKLADIRVEQLNGGESRVARAGSYALQQDDGELIVSLEGIRMGSQTQPQADDKASMQGSVRGKIERRCAYLGDPGANSPSNGSGQAYKVLTADPSWSSAFCAQHRE